MAKLELQSSIFELPDVPASLKAQVALHRGQPQKALDILKDQDTLHIALLKAAAWEQLGQTGKAMDVLVPWHEMVKAKQPSTAEALTHAGNLLVKLATLQGRPAQDYTRAMKWFSKATHELDRLYWPAYLAQGQLLLEKDNRPEAAKALMDVLSLNPQSSRAWYELGRMAMGGFAFDKAQECEQKLRAINPKHLWADLLQIELLLVQHDLPAAQKVLDQATTRFGEHRQIVALEAAAAAIGFHEEPMQNALARFEKLSPGNPLALATVGRFLSLARQYDRGEALLRQAIALTPNWPEPHSELGLLLMQAGDEAAAAQALREASRLDPFNKRVQNQLELAEHLLRFEVIRTPHFIIRYPKGMHEVLARDMPEELERIYRDITEVFEHEPTKPTQIQIMPNERWFGVRITGIPEIWTIAASTGSVIALTPPKRGTRQRGPFDWARVIRHEFVHTVTLSKTQNRLAHWFTEACAVAMEPGRRDDQTCQLLASALQKDKLFNLQNINWAFVRPKTPTDRPLAYAQASWMYEYITVTFGHQAILKMLDQFAQTRDSAEVIQVAVGQDTKTFMAGFKQWATDQVHQWGLGDKSYKALLKEAHLALSRDEPQAAREAVLRYANARPTDPWPHHELARLGVASGRMNEAIGSLEYIDDNEQSTGQWAWQLAKLYRRDKQWAPATRAINRALQREPYNGTYRELAAAIALQSGQPQQALFAIESLTMLEPDRAIHWKRLAALATRMGKTGLAKQATIKAKALSQSQNH